MKAIPFIAILLFISLAGFGKRIYTIPKSDFEKQFNDSAEVDQIYCFKENGEKVWLRPNKGTILNFNLNDGSKKKIILRTIRYKNGIITATEYNAWDIKIKTQFFNFADIASFTIQRKGETEFAYFDVDSCRKELRFKNDSLDKEREGTKRLVIYLIEKNTSSPDTISIEEAACYNMKFKDSGSVEFGVVQKITSDSFYISNYFNPDVAKAEKKAYQIFRYANTDITALRLLPSGGFHFRIKNASDYDIKVVADTRPINRNCWFTMYRGTCRIFFVRAWLTLRGFYMVTEAEGKVAWHEGG